MEIGPGVCLYWTQLKWDEGRRHLITVQHICCAHPEQQLDEAIPVTAPTAAAAAALRLALCSIPLKIWASVGE